jgi:hypothetical protein
MARYGRALSLVVLVILHPILMGAALRELPSMMMWVAVEMTLLGSVPFALAFVGQVLLGHRRLHDAVLLATASCAAVALSLGTFAVDGVTGKGVAATVMIALFMTWFMSLGALAARGFTTLRRHRSLARREA